MDGMSPASNGTGFRRDTTTLAQRLSSRQSSGSRLPGLSMEQGKDYRRPKVIDSLYDDPSFVTTRRARRPRARHPRHVDPPDPPLGTAARLCDRTDDSLAVI